MTTFTTKETTSWVDVECDGCKQGERLPVSAYGRRLCDVFPHIHECPVTV